MTFETLITILTSQVINKFSFKVAQKHATYKPGLVCKYNIQEMELVKGSAHALVYETGLLIGHTHNLSYFIFQLLVQKHKISTIKGVSFICATVLITWDVLVTITINFHQNNQQHNHQQ